MVASKGERLTSDGWSGWPLHAARFPAEGRLERWVVEDDSLCVWDGGKSEVTWHARRAEHTEQVHFMRHAGMVDVLPKGTVLEEIQWRGQACDCITVCFDAATSERLLGRSAAFAPDELRTGIADPHVVDLVRRLRAQALAEQPVGALYVEGLSLTLASYVYSKYQRPSKPADADPALAVRDVQSIAAYVEEHLEQSIRVAQLASLVGYGPDHFSRLFKGSFGRSPYQYVVDRRVERAKVLLREKAHSIADVATLCGFGSHAHFHSAFKARTGVTPASFRRH